MKKLLSVAFLASIVLAGCGNASAEEPQNPDLKKAEAKIETLSEEMAKLKDDNATLKEANTKIVASQEKAANDAKVAAEAKAKEQVAVAEKTEVAETPKQKVAETPKKEVAETPKQKVAVAPKQEAAKTPTAPKKSEVVVKAPEVKVTQPAKEAAPKQESGTITGREKGQLIAAQKKKLNNPNLTQSERKAIIAEIKRLGQLPVSN